MEKKYFARYKKPLVPFPDLLEMQKNSFRWLVEQGLKETFKEFSPIRDYTGKKFDLEFTGFELDRPKFDVEHAKKNNLSYEAPLRVKVKLINKTIKEEKEQEIFLSDFPIMTEHGTFIVGGVERVLVPQLARSFGVFFTSNEIKGKNYFGAKIIPVRGVWIELESEADGAIYARIDRKRKFSVNHLLAVLGENDKQSVLEVFKKLGIEASEDTKQFFADPKNAKADDSHVEIYRKVRDSDLATASNAREFVQSILGPEKYDLSRVGRFRFNKRFGKGMTEADFARRTLSLEDLITIFGHIHTLNSTPDSVEDDIDHLGLRRVRAVGEMLQLKVRMGLAQMKRYIQDKMSTVDTSTTLPVALISPRPLQARLKEFFSTNQLSQFVSQENLLSEVEHLRKLSALGPGGLTRERAGFEVRDIHPSHYGRLCPIQTPEGPNIGLILNLSTYARINDLGIIETPYAKVVNGKVTDEVIFLNALEEEGYIIGHSGIRLDDNNKIVDSEVAVRVNGRPVMVSKDRVEFFEIAPNQAFSVATSMIPFLEHDDANRALMGSNMQKQAVPCIIPEMPHVATGTEDLAARHTGRLIVAKHEGVVHSVDGRHIAIKNKDGEIDEFPLISFARTNQFTAFHQRPVVNLGDKVKKGQILADASSSDRGQIALGQNIRVAFMSWGGANFEDAIIISERLVRNHKFSSIHIEEFTVNVRDTKLGPEVTTPDIPNVAEAKLKDLDEEGIVRIGAEVRPNDILVGKITPKGETELTPEERLLRSIFGEKSRDVKDTSLRMDHGKKGRVIGVKVFSRDRGDKLESGIIKSIHIEIAQLRNVSVGDKLAGRHGNKGIVSRVLSEEDMPYMSDGQPVDMILTPLGVPSRMNLGQILEMHLGLAAGTLGYQAITPAFLGATEPEIKDELEKAGFPRTGKVPLYDGQTGEKFEQDVAIGIMYMLKLNHMVEDKIHMRSIGPYSLITQQPLGGKAQGGGQRFGEMEVWALEGYGAAHTLREMLTIKSDDIQGRAATFDAIVKAEELRQPNLPASFSVLLSELRGLGLDVQLTREDEETN